jgi:hypothetical protein
MTRHTRSVSSETLSFNINMVLVFLQLKSLFQIFTFISERNIRYQDLILASLLLIAYYRNSVSRFSTIQLWLINRILRVISWVFLILDLFVYFPYTFIFDPRVGRYEKSKMCYYYFQYYIWNYISIQYNGNKIYVNTVLT